MRRVLPDIRGARMPAVPVRQHSVLPIPSACHHARADFSRYAVCKGDAAAFDGACLMLWRARARHDACARLMSAVT